jgi:Ca2+/Na+ antiporter
MRLVIKMLVFCAYICSATMQHTSPSKNIATFSDGGVLCLETSLANDHLLIWATKILFVLVQLFIVLSNEHYREWNFPRGSKVSGNEIRNTIKVFS